MTDKEKELTQHYPEVPLIVEMAKAAWSGNLKAAKVNFALSDKLKEALQKLLNKEIKIHIHN